MKPTGANWFSVMLLIASVAILALIAVEGDQRIVHVTEQITDNILSSNEDDNDFICCVYGNCSCNSLDIALASLTSNVLINIKTDVMLFSLIKVSDIVNVSIIGYNNPSVNCIDIGGMHFTYSHNLIFKGITLSGCGVRLNYLIEPGLHLSYSSNIIIQNCVFQYSIGPAVVLLISKNVTVSSCSLFNNEVACIHVINQIVYFTGKILFTNNKVGHNDGIYISNHSTVIFNESSDVKFQNSDRFIYGILLKNNATILFDQKSTAIFNDNNASRSIISANLNSSITFAASCKVTFNNNSGPVISTSSYSKITFMGSSVVTFSNNRNKFDSIISSDYGYICFKENSSTMFYNNTGSAISLTQGNVSFKGNSYTLFYNNTANDGGAINIMSANISFEEKSTIEFCSNIATDVYFDELSSYVDTPYTDGGAIFSMGSSHITFGGNSSTLFSNNIADHRGGAVFTESYSLIRFCDNSTVTFTKNQATFGATVHCTEDSKIMATGDFTVIVDDLQAKWCTNVCMPYTDQSSDTVLIDSNGIVWCSNKNAFACLSRVCQCIKLEDIIVPSTKISITHITDKVVLSSAISLTNLESISIIGNNKPIVLCVNGSGLSLKNSQRLIIENITWVGCGDFSSSQPVLNIQESINVTIKNCFFQHSMGAVIQVEQMKNIMNIINCNFISNNHYKGHGSVIKYTSTLVHREVYRLTINNCKFSHNGAAESIVYLSPENNLYMPSNFVAYVINSSFCNNNGISIYISILFADFIQNSNIYLYISRKVSFKNNVAKDGAGIYSEGGSVIIFDKGSDVSFINNSVEQNGAAILMGDNSRIIFGYNARVEFNNNKASNGTVYSDEHSRVIFTNTCQVTFSDNSVTQYGAAIYSSDKSRISFAESSNVTFKNNIVSSSSKGLQNGGIIFTENYCHVLFEIIPSLGLSIILLILVQQYFLFTHLESALKTTQK